MVSDHNRRGSNQSWMKVPWQVSESQDFHRHLTLQGALLGATAKLSYQKTIIKQLNALIFGFPSPLHIFRWLASSQGEPRNISDVGISTSDPAGDRLNWWRGPGAWLCTLAGAIAHARHSRRQRPL
ncbi:MAG: hypothetical protein WCY29_03630 [Novosphingobium sp.]